MSDVYIYKNQGMNEKMLNQEFPDLGGGMGGPVKKTISNNSGKNGQQNNGRNLQEPIFAQSLLPQQQNPVFSYQQSGGLGYPDLGGNRTKYFCF